MIFISAGHHAEKQGAEFEGITEYSLTTVWADRIFLLLGADNAIRVPNGYLADKVDFINKHNANLAVEIHFNSFKIWKDLNENGLIDDGELKYAGRGSETLYYPGSKKGLLAATTIQNALGDIFPPNRGAKEGWYKMNPANGPDYFLKKTKCISLIIEPEFIDNQDIITDNMECACYIIADTLQKIQGELNNA